MLASLLVSFLVGFCGGALLLVLRGLWGMLRAKLARKRKDEPPMSHIDYLKGELNLYRENADSHLNTYNRMLAVAEALRERALKSDGVERLVLEARIPPLVEGLVYHQVRHESFQKRMRIAQSELDELEKKQDGS